MCGLERDWEKYIEIRFGGGDPKPCLVALLPSPTKSHRRSLKVEIHNLRSAEIVYLNFQGSALTYAPTRLESLA
eukprot:gene26434-biopygen16451